MTAAPSSAPLAVGPARVQVRLAAGAVTTTIACVLPVFLVAGLAVQMAADLGFSPAGLGLAVAVYFGVSALASVPAGGLVERLGSATTARAAIVLSSACMLAIAVVARSFTLLVLLLGASAVANTLGQLASNAALSKVPARRQGLSFGLKQSAIPLSSLVAGAAVPAVALTLNWRWAFLFAAGLAVTALALVPPGHARPRRSGARASRATGSLVLVGGAAGVASAAAGALATFLVDSSVARGIAPGLAGLTLTLGSGICVASRLFGGWFVDLRGRCGLNTISVLLVLGSTGVALLAVTGPLALIIGVAIGFGLGWAWPGLLNFSIVRMYPQAPAAATSITQTGVYAGACVGPLVFGIVAAHAGYPAAWLGAATAMLVAACLILVGGRLLERRRAATA